MPYHQQMAQRMILCAKTWTWLILSLEVIQKSRTVNVSNLANMFYEKFISICLTSFSISIKYRFTTCKL